RPPLSGSRSHTRSSILLSIRQCWVPAGRTRSRTSRGLWRRCKTWRCFVEWVGDAVAESKQDGSGQHRGKCAAPPDRVWRGSEEKATNRWAEGQRTGEGQGVEREVAAEQMGGSHVRYQRPE